MSYVLTDRNMTTETLHAVKIPSKHDTLCFCLPTVEPKTMRKLLLPSFERLKPIAEYITVAINFQKPYTECEMSEVVETLEKEGFRVRWRYSEYTFEKGAVPFNRIRNDCAELAPYAKLYALLDDDMTFEDGENPTVAEQYLGMALYMLTHPRCGIGIMDGKKPFSDGTKITPVPITRPFLTGRGLIFRPLKSRFTDTGILFPEDTLLLVGAGEEAVLAFSRLKFGFYIAAVSDTKAKHYENLDKETVGGGEQYGWADGAVVIRPDSCVTWQRFNGKKDDGYFDREQYFLAGGLAAEIEEVKEKYSQPIVPLEEGIRLLKKLKKGGR